MLGLQKSDPVRNDSVCVYKSKEIQMSSFFLYFANQQINYEYIWGKHYKEGRNSYILMYTTKMLYSINFLTLTQSGTPIEISLCYFNNFNHPQRD